ncbi:MAG TPA: DUF192 domain-containing protein [Candidatus Nanoarchaeia archaeon]|nr:DUF192 domain-containing protein [Candidatus Nanoarchaeia archaeon]
MLKNISTKKVIAVDIKVCRSAFSKARGLMFSKKRALLFVFNKEKKVSLHMFFVFFPIDVLYLSKNKKVVEVIKSFKPFTCYTPNHKAQYIIELPAGTIKATKTKIEHVLNF